tara:strand:+ start:5692 stop:6477 length:786 start_codon:yes stop_codon:yes gene_type:complete
MNFSEKIKKPITIFISSWGRPVYLWSCLDALYRTIRSPVRIVLLDNAHPDPLMHQVIAGFERRGLFAEVVRFQTNRFKNIIEAYQERLAEVGPWHVYMESDVVVSCSHGCWLAEMHRIVQANPAIGMLGSLIDTTDFIDAEEALQLTADTTESADFLAKLNSPERAFAGASQWADESRDSFPTEPPCPIGNPPGRLMMLRTEVIREHGFQLDSPLADCFRRHGFRPAVTARVRHRHLSLLNIFDHTDYSQTNRDQFFTTHL